MQLTDVLGTKQLVDRGSSKPHDPGPLLASLDQILAAKGNERFAGVSESLLNLFEAESAGVSIFTSPRHDELTWVAAAGKLAEFRTRRFPRRHSVCGTCLTLGTAQFFVKPHLYFRWLGQAGVHVREWLVAPLRSDEKSFGTIWVALHKGPRRFTSGDADALTDVGNRAAEILRSSRKENFP
jgi:hypothetical protein